MYHRVYSPNGEPFDVREEMKDHLVLQKGWTQTEPVITEPETDTVAPEAEEDTQPRRRRYVRKSVLSEED